MLRKALLLLPPPQPTALCQRRMHAVVRSAQGRGCRGIRETSSADRRFSDLSHVSPDGQRPKMVDVTHKAVTQRTARASALVSMPRNVFEPHLQASPSSSSSAGEGVRPPVEIVGKKGPVFTTAIIAGVMAAKNTSAMLPFCHPLPLESCDVEIDVVESAGAAQDGDRLLVSIRTCVSCTHKTGVEMEALSAASSAALCIYDMCKALSHDIIISDIRLEHKSGGKSLYDATR
eukprot:INCI15922.1.p1 GENE.INCI15922.1~~INCI15922.1.p1  ORF type:complete len:232 (-),score=34.52 INCI15922.1:62-757(-)